jgi:hypothetical protein
MTNTYVGKSYTDEIGEAIKAETSAERLRVWRPGTKGTMEIMDSRVNVYVNRNNMITKITMG